MTTFVYKGDLYKIDKIDEINNNVINNNNISIIEMIELMMQIDDILSQTVDTIKHNDDINADKPPSKKQRK